MSVEEQKKTQPDDVRRNRQAEEQAREADPLDGATVIPAIRHI